MSKPKILIVRGMDEDGDDTGYAAPLIDDGLHDPSQCYAAALDDAIRPHGETPREDYGIEGFDINHCSFLKMEDGQEIIGTDGRHWRLSLDVIDNSPRTFECAEGGFVTASPEVIRELAHDMHNTEEVNVEGLRGRPEELSESDEGTWVQAWVWVSAEDIQAKVEE